MLIFLIIFTHNYIISIKYTCNLNDTALYREFLIKKNLTEEFNEYSRIRTARSIYWINARVDIETEWWAKIGIVDGKARFRLYCNKDIEIILSDLHTNEKFLIFQGTHTAGYRKAQSIIKPRKVEYIDTGSDEKRRTIRFPIYGIWDGDKATFNDENKTVVRKKEWLKFI